MILRINKNKAFTLIELLAVTAVIALAVMGTTTLLMQGNERSSVLRYAQELALAARAARIQAVQHGQSHRLVLETETGSFFVTGSATDPQTLVEEGVISTPYSRPVRMPESIRFEKIGILGQEEELTEIEFHPNGSAQTALIQIGDGDNHATVTILEATGRVKMTPGELTILVLDQVDLDEIESVY